MPRSEFSKKVKAQAFERCNGCCERCKAKLKVGEGEYDHRIADALGGSNDLDNCQVLCRVCHRDKTNKDVGTIAKAKRTYSKHNGIKGRSRWPKSKYKRRVDGTVVLREPESNQVNAEM